MKAKAIKKRRYLWHKQRGRCFWCGRLTVLEDPPRTGGRPTSPLAATLDHLRSRYRPDRQEPAQNGERRIVVACWECNQKRCERETESKPNHELTRRAREGLERKHRKREARVTAGGQP